METLESFKQKLADRQRDWRKRNPNYERSPERLAYKKQWYKKNRKRLNEYYRKYRSKKAKLNSSTVNGEIKINKIST